MKHTLALIPAIAGLVLLCLGYTAPGRQAADAALTSRARMDTDTFLIQEQSKLDSAQKNPLNPELRSLARTWEHHFDDAQNKQTANLIGTIQYCAGWILVGIACLIYALPSTTRAPG